MITLSNGHSFEYVTASGALAFDGQGWPHEWPFRWTGLLDPRLFTNIIKTLTWDPRRGNLRWYWPQGCIRCIPDGVLNAVGLTNPGIAWWMRTVAPRVDRTKLALVGSILSDEISKLVEMAKMFNDVDVVALEVNLKCPNTSEESLNDPGFVIRCLEAIKLVSRHPVLAKVSVTHNVRYIAPRVSGMIEGWDINSVPWSWLYPHKRSPLHHYGGGAVSGKVAQRFTWELVQVLAEAGRIPVIGPSVWHDRDIPKLRKLGASAISFGSIHIRTPWKPTQCVRRDVQS